MTNATLARAASDEKELPRAKKGNAISLSAPRLRRVIACVATLAMRLTLSLQRALLRTMNERRALEKDAQKFSFLW
jgi:hypothetical protein